MRNWISLSLEKSAIPTLPSTPLRQSPTMDTPSKTLLKFERSIRNGSKELVRQSRRRRAAGAICIREGVRQLSAEGSVAIIVDDGLATGLTMSLAIHEARHQNPSKVVVAVPVAPPDTIAELKPLADDIVVLYTPVEGFGSIGAFYWDFTQVSDGEVMELMKKFLPKAA